MLAGLRVSIRTCILLSMTFLIAAATFAAVTATTPAISMPAAEIRRVVSAMNTAQRLEFLTEIGRQKSALGMSDEQITALYESAGSDILLKATRRFLEANPTYSFVLHKQERIDGKLNETPDVMYVRFREKPRAIYALWLKGGRHVGQEILFDEAADSKHFKAHAGGWLNLITVSLALDSSMARKESRHSIGELGLLTVIDHLEQDRVRLQKAGLSIATVRQQSTQYKGKRYWENVYETPGPPAYYAARARMLFDMENGVPRLLEVFDTQGTLIERLEYTDMKWIRLDGSAFDLKNPEYRF